MPKPRRRELPLQKKIVDAIRAMGGAARVLHQGRYSTIGDPDVYGVFRGRMFQFEVKEGDEQPTKIQRLRRKEWKKAGAITAVVRSVKQAVTILERRA